MAIKSWLSKEKVQYFAYLCTAGIGILTIATLIWYVLIGSQIENLEKRIDTKLRIQTYVLYEIVDTWNTFVETGVKRPIPREHLQFLLQTSEIEKRDEIVSAAEELVEKPSLKDRIVLFAKKIFHLKEKVVPPSHSAHLEPTAMSAYFVHSAYKKAGMVIPPLAVEQYETVESIPKEELRKGDIIFFRTSEDLPSLVAIYKGNNEVIFQIEADKPTASVLKADFSIDGNKFLDAGKITELFRPTDVFLPTDVSRSPVRTKILPYEIETLIKEGREAKRVGDFKTSIGKLEKAYSYLMKEKIKNETLYKVVFNLALSHYGMGENEAAERYYREASEIEARNRLNDPSIHSTFANFLMRRVVKGEVKPEALKEARKEIDLALKINPTRKKTLNNQGWLEELEKKFFHKLNSDQP